MTFVFSVFFTLFITLKDSCFVSSLMCFFVFLLRDKDPQKAEKWRVIVDEGLMKIESFPHFFHGDYCVPQVGGHV